MGHEGGVGDAAVGPAQLRFDVGMADGGPLDVGLVDHGVAQGDARRPVTGPVEERVGDDRAGCVRRVVGRLRLHRVVGLVGVERRMPLHRPVDGLGVRVEQELGGVAADAAGRIPRRVDPVAVVLARPDVGQVRMEAQRGPLRERDLLLRVVVEQAQLDRLRHLREDGEVGARAVVGGTEREGAARPLPPRAHRRSWSMRAPPGIPPVWPAGPCGDGPGARPRRRGTQRRSHATLRGSDPARTSAGGSGATARHSASRARSAGGPTRPLAATTPSTMSDRTGTHARPRTRTATVGRPAR